MYVTKNPLRGAEEAILYLPQLSCHFGNRWSTCRPVYCITYF